MIGIIIGVLLVLLIVVLMAIYVLKRQTNQYAKFMSPYSDYQVSFFCFDFFLVQYEKASEEFC